MLTTFQKQQVKDRDNNKCTKCGSSEELTIDHIIPKIRGGSDKISNLQTLCYTCNTLKSAKAHSPWQALKNWLSGNNNFVKMRHELQLRSNQIVKQVRREFTEEIVKLQNNQADLVANQRKLRDLLEDTRTSHAQLFNLHTALSGKHDKLLEYLEISWENILIEGYAPKPKPKPRVKKPIKEER